MQAVPVRSEAALAWALMEAMSPELRPTMRSAIFIQLGAGENMRVIQEVLSACIVLGVSPPPDLVARTDAWLDCYRGNAEEPSIRYLLRRAASSSFIPARAKVSAEGAVHARQSSAKPRSDTKIDLRRDCAQTDGRDI
jgi:hypothetical protein